MVATPSRRPPHFVEHDLAETSDKQTLLIVGDTPQNVELLGAVLGADYRIKAATSGERALVLDPFFNRE